MNKCKAAGSQALDMKEGLNLDTFYTRLIRFFGIKCADLFCLSVVHLILSIFSTQGVFYLAIDRTNWKIGNQNINLLFLGLILPSHHYIPIWWFLLDKRGNSNQKERKQLLAKVILISGWSSDNRFCLLADREFIGEDWLLNLAEEDLDFVIAIRDNMYLNLLSEQLEWPKERVERWMKRKVGKYGSATIPLKIGNQSFNYIVAPNRERNATYPFKKWISTLVIPTEVQEAYELRWKIEVFFKDIKSNGFGLEEMNFIKEEKIAILVACVGFLFALSVKKGEIEYLKKVPTQNKIKQEQSSGWRNQYLKKAEKKCKIKYGHYNG